VKNHVHKLNLQGTRGQQQFVQIDPSCRVGGQRLWAGALAPLGTATHNGVSPRLRDDFTDQHLVRDSSPSAKLGNPSNAVFNKIRTEHPNSEREQSKTFEGVQLPLVKNAWNPPYKMPV
jgi:hypothetical protein